jgi:pyroglutamyl-peptidase
MRILVTGFEPFDGASENPSAMIVERLAAEQPLGPERPISAILPVSATRMPPRLVELLNANRPGAILLLGEARGAPAIRIERVAVNLLDFRIPDSDGESCRDLPIRDGGPAAHFATLPVREIARSIIELGIPCGLSLSAGSYLCNQAMYLALDWAATQPAASSPRVGFFHLPTPGTEVSLEDEYRAVRRVLERLAGAASFRPVAREG